MASAVKPCHPYTQYYEQRDGIQSAWRLLNAKGRLWPAWGVPSSEGALLMRTLPSSPGHGTPLVFVSGLSGTKEDWHGLESAYAYNT